MLTEAILYGFMVCNIGNPQSHILTKASCYAVGPYMTDVEASKDAKKIKLPLKATEPAEWEAILRLVDESKGND